MIFRTFVLIKNNIGFKLEFNGHTIRETSQNKWDHNFIHLYRCNEVSIINLKYTVVLPDGVENLMTAKSIDSSDNLCA